MLGLRSQTVMIGLTEREGRSRHAKAEQAKTAMDTISPLSALPTWSIRKPWGCSNHNENFKQMEATKHMGWADEMSSPFQWFLNTAPRPHDRRKFSRRSLSPFFKLFSIINFFLHCREGETSLGWICFSCTVFATSSQCWDAVRECYHAAHVRFGTLKKLPLFSYHTSSPPIAHPLAFSPHLCTQPNLRLLLCDISENVKLWFQKPQQQ